MKTSHQHVQREGEQVLMRRLTWWLFKHTMLRTYEHGWTTWGPVTTWHSLVQPPMLVLVAGLFLFLIMLTSTLPHSISILPSTAPFSGQLFWRRKNDEGEWFETMHTTILFLMHIFNLLYYFSFSPLSVGWKFIICSVLIGIHVIFVNCFVTDLQLGAEKVSS